MEKDSVSNPKPKKSSRNAWIFIFVSFGLMALIMIIGIIIPLCMNDGTEGLSDKEKKAAQSMLGTGASKLHGIDKVTESLRFILKTRVEKIYPTADKDAREWCSSKYKEGTTYYTVEVANYTFFGRKLELTDRTNTRSCIDPDEE